MNQATITLTPRDDAPIIPRQIYGHFAEHLGRGIYEGLWVGEDSSIPNINGLRCDVVDALKALNIPVLRWPGGCFADEYHWRDGIGPRESRPRIYNSHWGGVTENNHFGTHEFMELCAQLDCEAYVCGNVGSGSVQEMSEWVEYMTSPADSPMANLRRQNGREEPWRLTWFGVGNESWGCGGNMRPEYYADLYRRYNTFVRTYGPHKIERIACGANTADFRWTEVMMEQAASHMDGLALHYYTILGQKWPPTGLAADFTTEEYVSTMKAALHMETLIQKHSEIMDRFDPERKVNLVVDEWGTWHAMEPGSRPGFLYQQNAMRDALVASVHFDIFHRYCERVRMANIAQMINVLQAMVLTDGPRMLLTPTYWTFALYAVHQDARRVDLTVSAPEVGELPLVSATASRTESGWAVSLTNLDPANPVTARIVGVPTAMPVRQSRVLAGGDLTAHNTFDAPDKVRPQDLAVEASEGGWVVTLPAGSLATVEFVG